MGKQDKKHPQKKTFLRVTENKYVLWGMLATFLLLVFFASSYKVTGDDDFFWHLATGRYVVENKVVPDKDIFGYTSANDEWIPFEWGWDVLTYGLYNLGGYNAILAFRSLAFCFIFLMLFLLLRKFKVNVLLTILLLFMLLVGVMDRLSPRPHIITYIFFVLLQYILLSYKYIERDKYEKYLYFLPLMFLVWGNSHMGVLAGGLFLFIYTVSEIIVYFKPQSFSTAEIKPLSSKQLKKLVIISAACAAVLLLNPHGLSTYIYAYSHTKMKMLETVNEWRNPFTGSMDFGFVVTFYKIFLFAGVLLLFYSFAKKDIFFALVFIGFAVYSVRAIRFTVDYEILIVVSLGITLNYYLNKSVTKPGPNLTAKIVIGSVPRVIVALFFVYLVSQIPGNGIYRTLGYYRVSGWGINDEFIPVQMFDFIKENNISGNVFNHFGTGGYLVWNFPGQKNFIDSRNLNDRLFGEYDGMLSMRPGFEKKLDQYGIDYVVYLDPDLVRRLNSLQSLLPAWLNKNPEWKLVFWDDKSMLFVKNIPKFAEVINKYEYKVLNPFYAVFSKGEFERRVKADPQRSKDEIKRKSDTEPNGFLLKGMLDMSSRLLQ